VRDRKKYDRKTGDKLLEECKEIVGKWKGTLSSIED
jgi:hypothetical protein